MIIGFCGKAGSGKDTAANFLVNNYGFTKLSLAKPVKDVAKLVFGLTDEEVYDPLLKEKPLDRYPFLPPRVLLQKIGTDYFRKDFPDVWIKNFQREAVKYENVVVADVRFPNEVSVCDKVYRVVMPELEQIKNNQHESETALDSYNFDKLINLKNNMNGFYIGIRNLMKDTWGMDYAD